MSTLSSPRVLVLSLAMIFVTACGAFKPGPASTVERFYRYLEKGQIDNAVGLVSRTIAEPFGDKLRSAMAEQTREISSKGGISSIRVENESVTGDTAEVVVTIVFGNGTTTRDTNKLVRENGAWRLTGDK